MPGEGFINRPMSIALDAVRGLAAVAVLLGHAVQQELYTGPWWFDDSLQHSAVVVFFVLSGLVIGNSVLRRPSTLADYAVARMARVVPMALFAVLLGTLAWAVGQASGIDTIVMDQRFTEGSLGAVIMPALFLSESAIGAGPLWNPPYWSLVYEVWFYALFGAAYFLRGWTRAIVLLLLALGAGLPVLTLLPVWLLGVALARFAPQRAVSQNLGLVLIVAGLVLLSAANLYPLALREVWMVPLGLDPAMFGFARYALSDLVFGLGVALAFVGLRPLADHRAALLERLRPQISWLAECSFTLYLIHWPILTLLRGWGLVAGDNPLLFAAIAALMVALAGQIAKVTEHRRPQVRRWLAAHWSRWQARRTRLAVATAE